jgi:hypothetical protein
MRPRGYDALLATAVAVASPVVGLNLAVITTDPPVLALILLALGYFSYPLGLVGWLALTGASRGPRRGPRAAGGSSTAAPAAGPAGPAARPAARSGQ